MATGYPLRALQTARRRQGVPQYDDFAVIATLLPEQSTESKLTLDLHTEDGHNLAQGWVFTDEWYPGVRPEDQVRFSHYFYALKRAFRGLLDRRQRPSLRLQVLKFVYSRNHVVLLKFVIGPEYTVNATQLQNCYDCPLQTFFCNFMGITREVTRAPSQPRHVAGTSIHSGYSRAALATWRGEPYEARVHAYWSGVTEVWANSLAYLAADELGDDLKSYHRQPLEVMDRVLARCSDKVLGALHLLQERDFFSPSRGMAGKADRIVRHSGGWHLYEIKTSTSPVAATDPRTGERVPGGIQSVAYLEILRTHTTEPASASVEEFRSSTWSEVRLDDHPVLLRAKAAPMPKNDSYIDLWAQLRNVAYLVTTGLVTGYNRQRIAELAFSGHRLRGLGGRFDLYASWPPCLLCPAHQRGVCDADKRRDRTSWPNFWLHVPQRLWEYWAWFHHQLKQEEGQERVRLYRIATADPKDLEARDGTCINGLLLAEARGRYVILQRQDPIVTRIRADDRVLLTPSKAVPGGLHSIQGLVQKVDANRIHLRLWEELQPPEPGTSFRVDQLGRYELIDWGIKGLADFLLGAMFGGGPFGRPLSLQELPPLARSILGASPLPPLAYARVDQALLDGLNNGQAQAIRAAMALGPGQFLLIQGPPGTGKTQTIARLTRLLVLSELWKQNPTRPVLILAFTNRACDEIVRKLKEIPEIAPFVIRVGDARSSTDDAAKDRILSEMVRARERMDRILRDPTDLSPLRHAIKLARLHWDQALVFVGTLAAAERPELAGLAFSTVIVDEAAQATEPHTLQALRHMPKGFAARLVLVGDHFQLPPVVQEETKAPDLPPELRGLRLDPSRGLQVSLFERLALLYPHRLLALEDQFRMNEAISSLVGNVFYQGRLRPASAEVAGRELSALLQGPLPPLSPSALAAIWDPSKPIVLLDTSDDPKALETGQADLREEVRANPREAEVAAWVVRGLLGQLSREDAETVAQNLGIISAYRSQNNLVVSSIQSAPYAERIRVDTVDRFQGSECEVVVVNLVDNNPARALGKLHRDWRRLNVALSRARSKLILVGSRVNFTARGPHHDEAAKAQYRRLFATVDQLAHQGRALVMSTRSLP